MRTQHNRAAGRERAVSSKATTVAQSPLAELDMGGGSIRAEYKEAADTGNGQTRSETQGQPEERKAGGTGRRASAKKTAAKAAEPSSPPPTKEEIDRKLREQFMRLYDSARRVDQYEKKQEDLAALKAKEKPPVVSPFKRQSFADRKQEMTEIYGVSFKNPMDKKGQG